jgi:hypothetical protein
LKTIRLIFLAFAGLTSATAVPAQEVFYADVTKTHLPSGLPRDCMASAVGDVDGDNDLDIALAIEWAPNTLLLNDGTGSFTEAPDSIPAADYDSEDAEFADLDGDGDLDLVIVNEDNMVNEFYLNDGSGRFIDVSDRLPLDGTSNAVAIYDLNGDGYQDILTGNYGTQGVMINDGRGHFSDGTEMHWQSADSDTQDLELVDIDGDGDFDVAVANEGQNRLYVNEGGRLVDATQDRLPSREDESREFRAADFDGDGDMDLILTNIQLIYDWPRTDYLLLNDGNGFFSDAVEERLSDGSRDHFSVEAVDLDKDGDPDILSPSSTFTADAGDYRVQLNDGTGHFFVAETGTILPASVHNNGIGFDIEVADFNQDGRDDLFLCNRSHPLPDPLERGQQVLLFQQN